jgi:hypothetical protein
MLKTITAGLLALLAWSMTAAHAADIGSKKFADCDESKEACYFIHIWGWIQDGDAKKFTDLVVSTTGKVGTILLDSPGGSFEDGMAIAKLVRERNFITSVRKDWECTSMCAIIWIAGSKRYYGGKTKIGFHSIASVPVDKQGSPIKGGKRVPFNGGNALVGAFFYKLGLNEKAIEVLTDAAPTSMYYLTTKRLEELGIKAMFSAPSDS